MEKIREKKKRIEEEEKKRKKKEIKEKNRKRKWKKRKKRQGNKIKEKKLLGILQDQGLQWYKLKIIKKTNKFNRQRYGIINRNYFIRLESRNKNNDKLNYKKIK